MNKSISEPVDEQAIKRDLLLALEYAWEHDDWVCPLSEALADLTAQQALYKPDPASRCIWEIVLHVSVWNENIVERMAQRLRGERPGRPEEGAWPPLPVTPNEAAWEAAKERLQGSLDAVRTHVETTPLSAMLDQGTAGYSQLADLLCRITHIAYHIGQITKMRERLAVQGQQETHSKPKNT